VTEREKWSEVRREIFFFFLFLIRQLIPRFTRAIYLESFEALASFRSTRDTDLSRDSYLGFVSANDHRSRLSLFRVSKQFDLTRIRKLHLIGET